jgi:hypothetical protein
MTVTMSRSLCLIVALATLAGCRGAPSEDPPFVPLRGMYNQPRYNVQARSSFFADGRTMRPLPAGVVATEMPVDLEVETGWSESSQSWTLTVPDSVVSEYFAHGCEQGRGEETAQCMRRRMLERGHQRYDIYCAPCHGLTGEGDGPVPTRAGGPIRPPTYHSEPVRRMPDGQMFATISNGVRAMPMYRQSIPTRDRWAIVSYVRALQLSQEARLAAPAGAQ